MEAEPLIISEKGEREDSYYYHRGDGFFYHFNVERFPTIYFVCASSTCFGRAKLRLGSALEQTQPHNHPSDLLLPIVRRFRQNIVYQAQARTYVSFAEIIRQERSRIHDREIRSRLTYRGLRSAMQRSRGDIFPRVPGSLQMLTAIHQDPAWTHLTQTLDQLDGIYSGSVDAVDGSHSIIYTSERNLQVLREVPTLFADGTFYISPSIDNCYQVFIIVSVNGHTVIPLVWCLMERKTEAAYIAVLVHLRVRLGHWNFTEVICDFETAIMNAFRRVFEILVQGCLFHYVNGIVKWARCNIPYILLRDFDELAIIIRCCSALPLLPQNLLKRGFSVIVQGAAGLGEFWFMQIVPFLLYIQTSWIDHASRGQSLSVCGSVHRTNNASESNNRRMNTQVERAHPNVFHLLHVLVQIEDSTLDDLNSLNHGNVPNRHRDCASISNDQSIIALTNQLLLVPVPTDEQILQFLYSAAFTLENVVQHALDLDLDNE